MRLVEFLIAILEAHAETLKRLAALMGEDNLIQLLELAGDEAEIERSFPRPLRLPDEKVFDPPLRLHSTSSSYAQLEGRVRELSLPSVLEFHLWAYPHYRAFIESPIDLNSRIPGPGGDTGLTLVDEAVAQARAWVLKLPISSALREQAARAAQVPWLRFRTETLKRIGKRPMGPVY